jgi:Mg/Co/Ni transporter MgtE
MGATAVYDLIGGRASWTALGLPTEGSVGDRRRIAAYVRPAATVMIGATVADVPRFDHGEAQPVAVTDETGVLLGALQPEAIGLPGDTPVERIMVPAPSTIRPELRVDEVARRLRADHLERIFVTAVNGTLFGVVALDDLHA